MNLCSSWRSEIFAVAIWGWGGTIPQFTDSERLKIRNAILKVGTWWFVAGSSHEGRWLIIQTNLLLAGISMISTSKKVSLTIVMCQMVGDRWSKNVWPFHAISTIKNNGYPPYIILWPFPTTVRALSRTLSLGGSWGGRTGCQQATRLHKQLGLGSGATLNLENEANLSSFCLWKKAGLHLLASNVALLYCNRFFHFFWFPSLVQILLSHRLQVMEARPSIGRF